MSLHDIADFVLEESIILTQSEVGFLGFMNDDESVCTIHAWSESAMQGCHIKDRAVDFNIAASGIWGECVRHRHPFILNNYAQPHELKRGLPEGHVPVTRFLSIPVFEGERIVAVLAVGNKHLAYDEQDIRQLTLLGDGMVRVIQRNQTQQELQHAKEMAEEANRTLREQQQQIQEQNQRLQELIGTKDKFFSIIAHDLKNPLSSFQSFVNLVSRNPDQWQPGEIQRLMGSLRENVDSLTALLDNLLTWARIEQGRLQLFPQKFDFEALALRNVELFRHMAAYKEISLAHTISRDTFVYADLNTVDTVVRNLVSNAVKFTTPGGSVALSAEQEADTIIIAVTDTGIGMSQDVLESIFRIDVQHHHVGTANEKGTGLGLVLCKEFVEKNGGELWAESHEGSGSVFRFTLPRCHKS
jgi:signal transduction histidine kinase